MHNMDADKKYKEKFRQELLRNDVTYMKQILKATLHERADVQARTFYL